MTNEAKKKDDGELSSLLLIGGLFTVVLLILDFTYSNFSDMRGVWLALAAISHVLVVISWVGSIMSLKDPNLEYWRKVLFCTLAAAIIVIFAHRSSWLDNKMFQEEVDQNKTEQLDDN